MQLARRHTWVRSSALLLVALGLTLRALIPAGYMPSADASGSTLVPCTGIAGGQAIDLDAPSSTGSSDAQQTRCLFGLLALGASDFHVERIALVFVRKPLQVRVARATRAAPRVPQRVHGARAPPLRS